MGTRRKLFAFSWSTTTIDRVYQRSDMTTQRERPISAPNPEGAPLPQLADLGWARDVYAYFGCKPYWE